MCADLDASNLVLYPYTFISIEFLLCECKLLLLFDNDRVPVYVLFGTGGGHLWVHMRVGYSF